MRLKEIEFGSLLAYCPRGDSDEIIQLQTPDGNSQTGPICESFIEKIPTHFDVGLGCGNGGGRKDRSSLL